MVRVAHPIMHSLSPPTLCVCMPQNRKQGKNSAKENLYLEETVVLGLGQNHAFVLLFALLHLGFVNFPQLLPWGLHSLRVIVSIAPRRRERTMRTCWTAQIGRKTLPSSHMWNSQGGIASPVPPAKALATFPQVWGACLSLLGKGNIRILLCSGCCAAPLHLECVLAFFFPHWSDSNICSKTLLDVTDDGLESFLSQVCLWLALLSVAGFVCLKPFLCFVGILGRVGLISFCFQLVASPNLKWLTCWSLEHPASVQQLNWNIFRAYLTWSSVIWLQICLPSQQTLSLCSESLIDPYIFSFPFAWPWAFTSNFRKLWPLAWSFHREEL